MPEAAVLPFSATELKEVPSPVTSPSIRTISDGDAI
jgi:hypothetical protein